MRKPTFPQVVIVIGIVLIIGAVAFMVYDSTDPWSLDQSVAGSEQVADASLRAEGSGIQLSMTMEENARINDPYCITTSNGNGGTVTTCYDDWHHVEVSTVSVVREKSGWFSGNEQIDSAKTGNGETAEVMLPWKSGEYVVYITAENRWTATLTIHIDAGSQSFEVTGSNYDNDR